ncbi:hypothetical protein V5P93_002396 [Actinokineospora auranticolor]|uniref:Uncharacterized protein n=1 Tax=Actinokineospora auranticolor TaxID=155976 RepID=A0A2S6GBX5_9PSEU|nr:hypothetical protein CLV40_13816 [Actinokineospora auranticolor]
MTQRDGARTWPGDQASSGPGCHQAHGPDLHGMGVGPVIPGSADAADRRTADDQRRPTERVSLTGMTKHDTRHTDHPRPPAGRR